MKIIITENQLRLIKENSMRDDLIGMIKNDGWEDASDMVGGIKNLMKLLNINSPSDFLHLFDDLEQVQSKKEKDWTLFRYKPNENLMIYDRKNGYVYINYYEIWSVLGDNFGLDHSETQQLTQEWLDEVYNLKGVTTKTTKFKRKECWMRSTI